MLILDCNKRTKSLPWLRLITFSTCVVALVCSDLPLTQGQESDSSETSVRGPRIKHVCRRAAVALGRKRAVFPDDMPTLSALPWEEREKILSSMGNDGRSGMSTWKSKRTFDLCAGHPGDAWQALHSIVCWSGSSKTRRARVH